MPLALASSNNRRSSGVIPFALISLTALLTSEAVRFIFLFPVYLCPRCPLVGLACSLRCRCSSAIRINSGSFASSAHPRSPFSRFAAFSASHSFHTFANLSWSALRQLADDFEYAFSMLTNANLVVEESHGFDGIGISERHALCGNSRTFFSA